MLTRVCPLLAEQTHIQVTWLFQDQVHVPTHSQRHHSNANKNVHWCLEIKVDIDQLFSCGIGTGLSIP